MNQSSRTLRSEDMIETIFLNIEVQYREQGGTARVIFFEDGDRPRLASRRYVVDLGGEAIDELIAALEQVLASLLDSETPFLLQPIFKTQGKKSVLADQCLDCFVWSNFALTTLFLNQAKNTSGNITRHERSSVWLFRMLLDFATNGSVDPEVIDSLTYNTKNDKAFASAGSVTNQYMKCQALEHPRVPKAKLREIILGGGQHFLSPERRFDAIIVNTPGLFD